MTRIIILGAILCLYNVSFGQTNDLGNPKTYTLKISESIDEGDIKLIQSQLEGYFDGILQYSPSTETFSIISTGVVEGKRIQDALLENNFSLTFFSIDETEVEIK